MEFNYTMSIDKYIKLRETRDMESIQREYSMGEGTVYTWELGYQCYLKKLSR